MKSDEYAVLEYQTCQQKISSAVEQLIRIELYVFLGISALYAWLYSLEHGEAPPADSIRMVLYLPPLLACLAWYRSSMQLKYIGAISEYLMLLEKKLGTKSTEGFVWEHVGWETWYAKNGPKTWTITYRVLLWPGLILGALAVAYLEIGLQ